MLRKTTELRFCSHYIIHIFSVKNVEDDIYFKDFKTILLKTSHLWFKFFFFWM